MIFFFVVEQKLNQWTDRGWEVGIGRHCYGVHRGLLVLRLDGASVGLMS